MATDPGEIEKRTLAALAAIKAAYGTEEDEYGATLFVSHHLAEIENDYWQNQFGTTSPEATRILDSLVLCSEFAEEDELNIFDFTLPGSVTDYVISVHFDDEGEVEEITMES